MTRDRAAVVLGLLGPLAGALVLLPWRADLVNTNVALILVVIVVAVAAMGNRIAGALAAVSSVSSFAWFDFFFTRPYERFSMARAADITTAVLLLLVGLAVSQLAARARRLRVLAITDAGYLELIHRAGELSSSARSPDAVVDHVKQALTGVLDLERCRFEYGSLLGQPPRLEPDGTVLSGHRRWDVDEFGFPDADIELRAFGNGQYFGRFMLTPRPGSRPSLQARLVAITLADMTGRALSSSENAHG